MAKSKKSNKSELLISINKAAYILNMNEVTLKEWIAKLKINIKLDSNKIECIDYNKDFNKLSKNPVKREKSQNDIKNYLKDCAKANTDAIQIDIESILSEYRSYIDLLESHHSSLIKDRDLLNDENNINAALLIFLKIINMCNMFVHSLQEGYNSAIILIRTIDEANTLAKYFVLLKDNANCQNDLNRWYRLDKSPPPSECREKVAGNLSKDLPFLKEYLHYFSDELYSVISKSVHHSFRDCFELLSLAIENNLIKIKGVYYKSVDVFRKDEVVGFFKSIINNVMQGFIICFKELPQEKQVNELIRLTTELSFGEG